MKKLALALAVIFAVSLIGHAVLNTRRSSVVTDNNQPKALPQHMETAPSEPAPVQSALGQDAANTHQDTAIVDKRGKGKIKPEEVLYAESAGREVEQTRMSRDGESESERKKGRYAFIGRVPKMAGQSVSNTPPIRDGRPTERRLNRAGRSFDGDLRNLPRTKPVPRKERPEREGPAPNPRELRRETQLVQPLEKLVKPLNTIMAPSPLLGFEGLDRENWGAGSPPDPNGDVGPTYYIQTVNTSVGIYDKTNGNLVTAFTFDTLMSQGNFGNQCDSQNFGDPVVLYDTFEDRWVLSDFAFTLDGGGNVNPPIAFQCFAVSKTGDPVSGGWNFYSATVTDFLNDYPKLGVWTDGIYMSANLFGFAAGGSFQGVRTWAFNKAQMYAGAPTAQVVSFNLGTGDFTVVPSNARLQVGTPPPGRPNLFVSTWNFLNAVTVYKFHVDWNSIGNSTFTGPDVPLASTSWPNAAVANAPQPGTATLLDVLQIRAMMQNQYTNYGGVESLWASHTVRRGNTTGFAAPRWYQVNVTGGTVAANLPQAATWDPDAANVLHRFMPSLALDRQGNLAMGYSTSSTTVFPSFAYAGRLAADPVNTFSQTEQTLFAGTASQTGSSRWGDYSSMTLDPDGCTFWYTNEYANPASQAANMRWKTRINSFSYASIGQCTPVGAGGTIAGTVSATMGGAPISGATVALGARTATTNGAGFYQFLNIPAGTYPSITASAQGYNSSTANSIVVTDGNTTTQNFSLGTAPDAACLTDTTQADFQTGVGTNVDLTTSPGDVKLLDAPTINQQNATLGTSGVGITVTTWGGQTFTPSVTGTMPQVDINLFCSGCSGTTPNLTLSLRATSGGLPTGADLASATITGFSSGASAFYTATFSSPPTLNAGTQYAIVIRPTANPSPGTYALTRSGTATAGANVYAGGARVSGATSGTVWSTPLTGGVSTDAGFRIYLRTGFALSGNLVSSTKDANPAAGNMPHWTTLSWTAVTPANTDLKFQAAGSNSPYGPFNFVGPDGTAATFFTTSGASLSQFDGLRYLQYKAFLSTTDNTMTPTLNDVTVCYSNLTGTVSGGGTICTGASTNVTVTVSGGTAPYTVVLTNGGGTQTGSGPVFTFQVSPGSNTTYMLAAGSMDANSNSIIGSGSATVMVNPIPPTPTITPGGPTTFCEGGSVTLTSSSATGNQWYLNGNPIGGATNQTYVATASGSYTVVVTALGCPSLPSSPTIVTVNPIPPTPTITPGGPTTFCAGGSVTLTSSSATGNQWYLNGNLIGGETNQTYVATASGNYTVVVTANGCASAPSTPTTVTVNPTPPTPTITPGGPTTFCAGGSVTLTSSGATGNQWYLNGNPIGGATNQTYVATASGNYTVVVTANGCPSAASTPTTVTVNPIPPTPTISPNGSASFCPGGSVTLTSSSATGNQWFLNGNPIGGATNQTYVATAAGSYTVVVTANGCASAQSAPTVVTASAPPAAPTIIPSGTVTFCPGSSQTLTSSSTTGNQWFLNGNPISGATNQTYIATSLGNYTVISTVNGCVSAPSAATTLALGSITVNPNTLPGGAVGSGYNQTLSATLAGTYSFTVTNGALPTGLTLNAATGVLNGTPASAGSYNFRITATRDGCSGFRDYTVAIACATVTITPPSLPAGQAGVGYSQTISVSPAGSYTFSLLTGNLPSGLTLNPATGVISGTPSSTTTSIFTIKAEGAGGCSGTATYTLSIGCPTITVNPASLLSGSTGVAYNQTLSATPAGGNYTFAITGSLPPGLSLNPSNGLLTGTPTANGTYTFTVTATGFGACTGNRSYTVLVGTGSCPTITLPGTLPNSNIGQLYSNSVAASPINNYTYKATGNLPPGVTLYEAFGLLLGYPTTPGSYNFTITATGINNCTASQSYTVVIGAGFASSLTVFSDFDGDGKSDLSVFRQGIQDGGNWLVTNSGNGQVLSQLWGAGAAPYNDIPVPGDYDGDGKTDLAVFRRGGGQAGYWYIKRSQDGQVTQQFWGLGTDVPVTGDYDGDGKTDVAVWRGSEGNWYIMRSSDGSVASTTWGAASVGDLPVPGDYDGDGKTDMAVFRRSTGYWYVKLSSNSETISKLWGISSDVPVPGDYDGDGKTDIAVWRAGDANCYIVRSSNDTLQTVSLSAAATGDVAVPADYDGDGKADAAVWRESNGMWYVKRSSDGVELSKAHGRSGDVPIMARRNN